jgi:hypothetical protein
VKCLLLPHAGQDGHNWKPAAGSILSTRNSSGSCTAEHSVHAAALSTATSTCHHHTQLLLYMTKLALNHTAHSMCPKGYMPDNCLPLLICCGMPASVCQPHAQQWTRQINMTQSIYLKSSLFPVTLQHVVFKHLHSCPDNHTSNHHIATAIQHTQARALTWLACC